MTWAAKDKREKERQGHSSHSTAGSTHPPSMRTRLDLGQCQHTHKAKAGSTKLKNCYKLLTQHVLCSGGSSGYASTPGITKHCLWIVDSPSLGITKSLAAFPPVNKAGPVHPAACGPHQLTPRHSFGLCLPDTAHTSFWGWHRLETVPTSI